LALAIIVLGVGCTDRASDQSGGPSALSTGPTTTPDPRNEILAAYRAYWADVIEAGKTADANSPRLDDHATGKAVTTVRDNYRQLRAQGLVDLGMVALHPRVTAIHGDTATIDDCTDVTHFLRHDAATGKAAEPEVRDVRHILVALELVSGRWLVSDNEPKGQCAP
jgi:hypothetical protein